MVIAEKIENNATIADELRALELRGGHLRAGDVVDAARDTGSPLHHLFEWDDDKAGEAYRLLQAAELIRRVKIVVSVEDVAVSVNRYISTAKDSEGGAYRVISRVNGESVIRTELAQVIGVIDRVLAIAAAKPCETANAVVRILSPARDGLLRL